MSFTPNNALLWSYIYLIKPNVTRLEMSFSCLATQSNSILIWKFICYLFSGLKVCQKATQLWSDHILKHENIHFNSFYYFYYITSNKMITENMISISGHFTIKDHLPTFVHHSWRSIKWRFKSLYTLEDQMPYDMTDSGVKSTQCLARGQTSGHRQKSQLLVIWSTIVFWNFIIKIQHEAEIFGLVILWAVLK